MRQEVIALENNTKFSLLLWFLSRLSYEDCIALFPINDCTAAHDPIGSLTRP